MFEKLTFNDEKERNTFEKYVKLKGKFLHKQIYDILSEANGGEVTYYELSSFIRYDKNLRDTLYIYLAMSEEYLRALVLNNYTVEDGIKNYRIKTKLIPLEEGKDSGLYPIFKPFISQLIEICNKLGLTKIQNEKLIKTLRNSTMHHNVILFGRAHDLKEAYENFSSVERQLNALKEIMPDEYWQGFLSSLQALNGKDKKFLNKFYLEINDGKIRTKK